MTNIDCNKENVSLLHGTFDENSKSLTSSSHHPQQQQPQNIDWVDTVVNCATVMNKIFTRNTCRLCHIYSDKQVEFEERIQQNATITATATEWYNLQTAYYNHNINMNSDDDDVFYQQQQHQFASSDVGNQLPSSATTTAAIDPEAVELYRKYLFDEESVVDSIELRIGRSTDNDEEVDEDNNNIVIDDMKDVQLS